MRRTLLALIIAAAALLTGCSSGSSDTTIIIDDTDTSGNGDGKVTLDSVVISCTALDPVAFPIGVLTEVTTEQLSSAQCVNPDSGDIFLDGELSLVTSGRDRDTMELTEVDKENNININVESPGPDCVTTMEWRGDMALLIADVPTAATVTLTDIFVSCGN